MSVVRARLLKRLWYQVLGLVFLVVVALFFVTTIGVYNKEFTSVVNVTLKTDHAGNQMREGADVKVRGMVVGEVSEIHSRGDHAALTLALQPEKTDVIPPNVSARLLPKTLFGERYVALQLPKDPPPDKRIDAHDVISQDRSSSAIETEKVLNDVMPLLQAVQPQKLSSTLNAVSTALDGRGEQLGHTLNQVAGYLGELNPSLPDLKANITGLANVADTYDRAAPDFLNALSDLTTTTRTFADNRSKLENLYSSVRTASTDMESFLRANKDNLIKLTTTVQPTLDVLAKYAPEYPCMFKQLAGAVPLAEEAFGAHTDKMNHVVVRFTANRTEYKPGVDEPRYDDKRGPRCYPQVPPPGHWPQYPPDGPIKDGSSKQAPPKSPGGELPGGSMGEIGGVSGGGSAAQGAPQVANSPKERNLISALRGPALGVDPSQVPNWSSLLVGPLYRGAEVELK